MEILLTKSTMPVISWIAQLLGWVMNGIYEVLDAIGNPNIGIAIILYTVIVYVLMTPLQISQQKTSKMMSVIQPELTQLQKKYQGKRDQNSQMKMQEETMALYNKYGVSPTGSCLPLLIQLPLLFALYQVIYHIPGYIAKVGLIFSPLANSIYKIDGASDIITTFVKDNSIRLSSSGDMTIKKVTDFLYLLKPSQWDKLADISEFSSLKTLIHTTAVKSQQVNEFFGINISESPMDVIVRSFRNGSWLLLLAAVMVPVLAWFTQWLNYKLMPQQATQNSDQSSMGNSMKTMNTVMPVFSAVMCVTFSMGIGIYWIAGAVIRCIQQVVINRRIAKMNPEDLIQKAQEKAEKKRKKKAASGKGAPEASVINRAARTNVKKISEPKYKDLSSKEVNYEENASKAAPNSITAKANMVRAFDARNATKNSNNKNNNRNNTKNNTRNNSRKTKKN